VVVAEAKEESSDLKYPQFLSPIGPQAHKVGETFSYKILESVMVDAEDVDNNGEDFEHFVNSEAVEDKIKALTLAFQNQHPCEVLCSFHIMVINYPGNGAGLVILEDDNVHKLEVEELGRVSDLFNIWCEDRMDEG